MRVAGQDPVRVLHVVGRMERAGLETWLMHVLRHVDRERFYMDFLVHSHEDGAYDAEVRALGSRLLICDRPSRLWRYARNFHGIVRQNGPYDVVHSHVHHFNGYVLYLARQAGVPIRIAHSHIDIRVLDEQAGPWRRVYLALMARWIRDCATCGLACSRQAAASLFGTGWQDDTRLQVLYYGIDLAPFKHPADRDGVRAALGIPPDAYVVGHVGRFTEQKNQAFVVDIAAELIQREPRTCFLLVGDGPLRREIEAKAQALGVAPQVLFTGVRADIAQLMLGAMDAFLFPSLYEGLGLALVEAQAAGLPCLLSHVVPEEVEVVRPLLRRLSLSLPASAWAEAVLAQRRAGPAIGQQQALATVENSPFNIHRSVRDLEAIYSV